MALTIYEKLRGALSGVGHAGDRIAENVAQLTAFSKYIPEGPNLQLFNLCLKGIQAEAEQLKTANE